ncbi:hypothetical protein [Terribacillus saccharophilus]|uniref:Uncharacterized protein n=1 Tax=Terribacillus saccharophilus TaxID=361277 RepID=A0ABX4GXW7_9BACI|nr:hypothetical protein [Terribacillus saccharophilus]PAD33593.1 hypothetical protein CHH56_18855 [Terribacillus saccharophilus]PAD95867.1 hypothetical protein CHH50_11270 [Terribacillus saccharophilus]PAD99649.1 hypothetical protein CHH48_10370 [Terribacillus saccharophilus]
MEELLPLEPVVRQHVFVGRNKELAIYHNWLAEYQAVSTLFVVSGMGGIGKSALLAKMNHDTKTKGIHTIFLDGSVCPQTPSGFMEYIHMLIHPYQHGASIDVLIHNPLQKKIILYLDHFDELTALHSWFINAFLPHMAAKGIGIVLATRKSVASPHIRTVSLPLTHFTYEETLNYINAVSSLPPKQAHQLASKSDGFPLGLALAVDMVTKSRKADLRLVSQTISAKFLREVTAVSLHPLLEVLIVMEYANQEMLAAVLQRPICLDEYRALQKLSFIDLHPYGLKLHEIAKTHLKQDFQMREPSRLASLHRKCMQVLYQQLTDTSFTDRAIITSALLKMNRDTWPKNNAYLSFTSTITQVETDHIVESDIPILHDLIEEWCSYSVDPEHNQNYHKFLDALIQLDPDSILLLRNQQHLPTGMFITVHFSTKTAPLLLHHFRADLDACFTPEGCRQAALQADTFVPILITATEHHLSYTRQELTGMLIMEQLAKLAPGKRAILVATNESFRQFLRTIGFQSRPAGDIRCDTSWAKAEVLELDLRKGAFEDWIFDLVPINQKQALTLTIEKTRKLLHSIKSTTDLEKYADYFTDCANGHSVQKKIMSLMEQSDQLTPDQREVLWISFIRFPDNAIRAAEMCNMSRATFYRHQKKAIQQLTNILCS